MRWWVVVVPRPARGGGGGGGGAVCWPGCCPPARQARAYPDPPGPPVPAQAQSRRWARTHTPPQKELLIAALPPPDI